MIFSFGACVYDTDIALANERCEQHQLRCQSQQQYRLRHYGMESSIIRTILWSARWRNSSDEMGWKWYLSLWVEISVLMLWFISYYALPIGSFFRAAIPTDVTQGTPNPSLWGPPSAMLKNTQCDIGTSFNNHQIVFGEFRQLSIIRIYPKNLLLRYYILWFVFHLLKMSWIRK